MKIRRIGSIMRYGAIGAAALFCLSTTASAAAIGNMNEANCSGGGAQVTLTTITWLPAGTVAGTGCIDSGAGTSLSYSGGTLGPGVVGNIANLTFGTPPPIDNFITFSGTTLDFVLVGFNIPATTDGTNCAATTSGDTCTVFAGSPFILTNNGSSTGISLTAIGTITDGGVVSNWTGIWTTQLNQTAATIQTTILGGGTEGSTQSGAFTVSVASVPEPVSLLFIGSGLIGLAMIGRWRKARS